MSKGQGRSERLTERELKFCHAYLRNGRVQVEAAMEAYGWTRKSASAHACKVLKRPVVQGYIKHVTDKWEKEMEITTDLKLKKLWHITNSCAPDDARSHDEMDVDGACKAIDIMNKMQGHYAPTTTTNLSVNADADVEIVAKLTDEYKKEF